MKRETCPRFTSCDPAIKSLPYFGAVRNATPDAWGCRIIEAKLGVPLNALPKSQYLLHAGSDRVGALDVRSDASAPPLVAKDMSDTPPHVVEAAALVDCGMPVPPHLAGIFTQGAPGEARPKATVRDEIGALQLAKFSAQGDRFDAGS